jgi:hypothetical protein
VAGGFVGAVGAAVVARTVGPAVLLCWAAAASLVAASASATAASTMVVVLLRRGLILEGQKRGLHFLHLSQHRLVLLSGIGDVVGGSGIGDDISCWWGVVVDPWIVLEGR